MANQITDNRTAVYAFDATTSTVDLAGAGAGSLDSPPEVFIQNGASIGSVTTSSRTGIMYDAGSAQDWSNNVFYIWINCGIVGLLDLKANAGFTIRFAGATVTDWFEVYVGGSDSWPPAVEGGWVQFVVDIEDARAAAIVGTVGGVNGTTPATSAIQYVGWSAITATVMTKMVDNTWIDEIRRLPDGSPGIIVEGRNGGSTDWDFDDIITELGIGVGTAKAGPGGAVLLNTPVQFGIDDTSTHAFTDLNKIILWEDQEFAPADLYGFSALGNSGGTTDIDLGLKTGTGDDATGAQGIVVSAAASGVRWSMDFNDPNLDSINLYGCQFQHGSDFLLDDAAVSVISTTYLDCTSAEVHNSEQLRNSIVDANTADGVAFMRTDDINDIKYCSFGFSDGHAIELDAATPTAQSNVGNLFNGYTNSVDSTDAAVLNSAAGALTITNSLGSNLATNSYRDTGGGSVTIVAGVPITLTFVDDSDGSPIEGLNVTLGTAPGLVDVIDNLLTNASGVVDISYTGSTPDVVEGFAQKGSEEPVFKRRAIGGTVAAGTGLIATIRMSPD